MLQNSKGSQKSFEDAMSISIVAMYVNLSGILASQSPGDLAQ